MQTCNNKIAMNTITAKSQVETNGLALQFMSPRTSLNTFTNHNVNGPRHNKKAKQIQDGVRTKNCKYQPFVFIFLNVLETTFN